METAKLPRNARLEARITAEQKALVERAAAYLGRTVSDFVVQTVQEAAKNVIHEHEVVRLDRRQSQAFVDALLNPPEPNEALRKAAKAYHHNAISQ